MKWNPRKLLRYALFISVGAGLGWIYYRFWGCTSGCAITSSPVRTMLYTAIIGGLLGVVTERTA